jgi:hypothetical protein
LGSHRLRASGVVGHSAGRAQPQTTIIYRRRRLSSDGAGVIDDPWSKAKAIVFLINNSGYTIERLILGGSVATYNDINQWRYAEAVSFFDTADEASSHRVCTEGELEAALSAATLSKSLVLIEVVMNRMDAPKPLVHFARKCAEINFAGNDAFRGREAAYPTQSARGS